MHIFYICTNGKVFMAIKKWLNSFGNDKVRSSVIIEIKLLYLTVIQENLLKYVKLRALYTPPMH